VTHRGGTNETVERTRLITRDFPYPADPVDKNRFVFFPPNRNFVGAHYGTEPVPSGTRFATR
jgi:hypothetical protein